MTLLSKLKKRKTALYASLFAVIFVGTPHIVPVVSQFSQFKTAWLSLPHALFYALALEVGIVFFALRSKMTQTIVFAIIATTLYLGYYDSHIPWISIVPIMPLVISISLPIMIVLIAHETGRKRKKRNTKGVSKQRNETKERKRATGDHKGMFWDDELKTWTLHTDLDKVIYDEAYGGTVGEAKQSDVQQIQEMDRHNGTSKQYVSAKPRNPKPIPEEIRREILKLIADGKNYREIAKMTNTSISTISRVKNEQTEQNETTETES